MFRGQYEHSIDAKGRTSLPAKFRDAFVAMGDTRMVVTTGLEPCLALYPFIEWQKFEERLSQLPKFDPSVTLLRRVYVSSAVDLEVDKLGRLLIPQNLREYAGLEKDVLFAAMGPHIELWSKRRFEAMRSEVLASDAQRQDVLRRLSELGL